MSTVATTIYKQLGGHKTQAMIGGHTLVYYPDALSFKFKMCKEHNYVKITLTALDLYDIEFGKIWGLKYRVTKKFEGVYFDQLITMFEETTKLYTKLF